MDKKNIVSIEKKTLNGDSGRDMGELDQLARIACETGYIDEKPLGNILNMQENNADRHSGTGMK